MRQPALINSRSFIAVLAVSSLLIFCQAVVFSAAQEHPQSTAAGISSDSSVDTLLAGLSDVQVRQMLLNELKKEAESDKSPANQDAAIPGGLLGNMLGALSGQTDDSEQRMQQLWRAIPNISQDFYTVFLALCPLGTSTFQGAMTNFILVLLFVAVGFIAERLITKFVLGKYFKLDANILQEMSSGNKFFASTVKKLPDFIGLVFFFGVSYFSFFAFAGINSPLVQLFFLAILLTISLIRIVSMCLRIPLSPSVPAFRIVPLETEAAQVIYRILVWTFGYFIAVVMLGTVIHKLGAALQTVQLIYFFFATLLLAFTGIGILYFKNRVKEHIICNEETQPAEHRWGREQFADVWHVIAILYLVTLWILLVNSIADPTPDSSKKGAFLLSFFVVPLWLIADRIVHLVVRYAINTLNIYEFDYADEGEVGEDIRVARESGRRFYLKMDRIARTGLIFALLVWVASLWNIKIPLISNLAGVLLDGFIIVALALFVWKFISSWIERKIQDSIPEGEEEKDEDNSGEFGTAPARGRSYTLLPMVRKFIGTVLVVMVSMTILSSMGVDIGPLLAGAGVIGLAVGFGAQKLVADMFSGFFYLMDDAFRVGEYLTAGSVSGTVESITLRNIMLRHHRGMLQIVPHSQLGAITNFMRGGMIVKFNLDFPYDADIDKIRKIIKKVGQAMLDDEEFGDDFIQPVKSQGVREITNSVMTIRVKFTAKPGTHFVIRREAFKRITEDLAAKGIHYAHKKVIVDVPGLVEAKTEEKLSEQQVKTIANSVGAAGLASINAEEEQAAALKSGKPKPDIPD